MSNPIISILMSTYNPNMSWLRKQFESLNMQTYPSIALYIRDDHSDRILTADIEALARECIINFPFYFFNGERNLGSNGSFEWLTKKAEGKYFAYCDQDDIWHHNKLSVLYDTISTCDAQLVCSDMLIINQDDKVIAKSITEIRKSHKFRSGDRLTDKLLVSNWVTGCTMLVRSEVAKAAVPFCPYMVHDHYIALYSASLGKIISLPDKLIDYRVHDNNQTSIMRGVVDKDTYYKYRIESIADRFAWLKNNFCCTSDVKKTLDECLIWSNARKTNWIEKKNGWKIIRYMRFSPKTSLFELVGKNLSEKTFLKIINMKKDNRI